MILIPSYGSDWLLPYTEFVILVTVIYPDHSPCLTQVLFKFGPGLNK